MEGQSPAPTATGSLAKTPFPHLLVYALERRLSGTFVLATETGTIASMVVHSGCPAKVHTTVPIHQIGVILEELGMITREQLESSLERKPDETRRSGEILLDLGTITKEQLETGLREQVERKVEHLFALPNEATFAYYDAVDLIPAVGGPQLPIDPFPVMWRGVRQTPPWEHVDATLKRIDGRTMRPSPIAQFSRFAFAPQELKAIDRLVDRPARVVEITSMLGPSAGQIFVYLLTIMKQVELVETSVVAPLPSAPATAPIPPPSSQSSVSRSPASTGVAPASGGQAFARLQLQRQAARPLVVEEQVARSSTWDSRASHPDMQGVAAAVRAELAAREQAAAEQAAAEQGAPEQGAPEQAATGEASNIGSSIANALTESLPPAPAEVAASSAPSPKPPAVPPPLPTAPRSAPVVPAAPIASAAPPALTEEQAALRAKIVKRSEEISSQNYFEMLGVAREATPDAIQKAFIVLAKTWHPDRLPPALADVKDACSKVFSHLTEANATLTDPVKRQDYMTLLKDGGATPDDQAKIQAILEAATEFQKVDILIKRNLNDPQAIEMVRRCVELDDHQTDYVATLAWLEAHRPEWQAADKTLEKVAVLDKCIERNPNSERALYYRAMLLKRADQPARAMKDFKKVAEMNPRNLDAAREVRLHNMRSGGGPQKPAGKEAGSATAKPNASKPSGLLGKLFKK